MLTICKHIGGTNWGHNTCVAAGGHRGCGAGAPAPSCLTSLVGPPSCVVQGIRTAFDLPIGLDVLVNDDPTKVFFNYDVSSRFGLAPTCPASHRLCSCCMRLGAVHTVNLVS